MRRSLQEGCESFRQTRLSRRRILEAGVLGSMGLSLPELWLAQSRASAAKTSDGFGRAKSCIFLFMWGGPSQLDTFDLKPDAPAEVRGEFKPISTKTPGLLLCEHFKELAGVTDKLAVIRSLNHDDPAHLSSGHTTLTGQLPPVNKSDAEPPSDRDTPHLGCVMSHLRPATVLPSFVTLPWKVLHPAAPGGHAPGQHGGWLGRQYDPFVLPGDPSQADWQVPALALTEGVTRERMQSRVELLRHLDAARAELDSAAVRQWSHLSQRAFGLLASPQVRGAFDLTQEPPAMRERYGNNIHGQCVLLARRLVEHGVPIVSVNWHHDGRNFWDTHGNNFNRLKDDLIPPADRALSALIADLDQRNLLDDTLVVWVGEFGRKPQISKNTAGREHWPFCYSGILAGAGVRGGAVYGSSDKLAAYPQDDPVSPHDLVATVYHALGVPRATQLYDQANRPHHLYAGEPINALFG
jgi:hypothetical protein